LVSGIQVQVFDSLVFDLVFDLGNENF